MASETGAGLGQEPGDGHRTGPDVVQTLVKQGKILFRPLRNQSQAADLFGFLLLHPGDGGLFQFLKQQPPRESGTAGAPDPTWVLSF